MGLSSAASVGGLLAHYSDLVGFRDQCGNQQPGNLNGAGNLRTADAATAADGATTGASTLAGGKGADGKQYALTVDTLNRLLAMDANDASYTPGVSSTAAAGTFNSVAGIAAPKRFAKQQRFRRDARAGDRLAAIT